MRMALILLPALVCFSVPVIWARVFRRRWGEPVRILSDERVSASDMAGYLAEVARHLDERPRRLRITFRHAVRTVGPLTLDFTTDRKIAVTDGTGGTHVLDLRGRWIPEHPVPLRLGRRTRLYVEPTDGNRFRVRTYPSFPVPPAVWILCSAVAACGAALFSPTCFLAALGAAAGCRLVHRS